jgi:hypothetical protein
MIMITLLTAARASPGDSPILAGHPATPAPRCRDDAGAHAAKSCARKLPSRALL